MSVSTITREVISVVPDTSRLEFFSAELLRKLTWPGRTAKDEEGRARGQSGEDEGGNDDGCGDAKGSGNVKLVWGEGKHHTLDLELEEAKAEVEALREALKQRRAKQPSVNNELHTDVGGHISDGDEDPRKSTITSLQERLQGESQARVQAESEAQALRQNLEVSEKEQASTRALTDTLKSIQDQLQCRLSETASLLSQLEAAVSEAASAGRQAERILDTAHAELTAQEKELSLRQAKVEALQREVERLTVKIDHTVADLDSETQKRRLAEVSGARQKEEAEELRVVGEEMRAALLAMKEVQIQDELKLSRMEGQLSDARAQIMSHTLKEQRIATATSTKNMEISAKESHQQISLSLNPTTHSKKRQRTVHFQHDGDEDGAVTTSVHCCTDTVSASDNQISMQKDKKDDEAGSSIILDNIMENSKCIDSVDPMQKQTASADPGLENAVLENLDGGSPAAAPTTKTISHPLNPSLQDSHVATSPADATKRSSYTEDASSSSAKTKIGVDIADVHESRAMSS